MIFSGKTGKGKSYQWVDPMLGEEKEKSLSMELQGIVACL